MIKKLGVTNIIAQCKDCDWRAEGYKNGQAIAAIHAKSKKHKVMIEVGLSGFYDGRKVEDERPDG